MAQDRVLPYGSPLPASWLAGLQEFLSTANSSFQLSLANAQTVQVVAGTLSAEVGIAVDGLFRYISSTVTTAITGAGGPYDIFVVVGPNSFSNSPTVDTDNTVYAFALQALAQGTTPTLTATVTNFRKVGELDWDGSKVIGLRQLHGELSATAPLSPLAPAVAISAIRARAPTGQTASIQTWEVAGSVLAWVGADGSLHTQAGVVAAGSIAATGALSGQSLSLVGNSAVGGNATVAGTLTVTGVVAMPGGSTTTTPASTDNSTEVATTAFVKTAITGLAPLASPTFTGLVTVPVLQAGTNTRQSGALISAVKPGDGFEWGHSNTAGYRSTLGAQVSSGWPYLAFSAAAGTTANTFKTSGVVGSVFQSDLAGGFQWLTIPTASADNQAGSVLAQLSSSGSLSAIGGFSSLWNTGSALLSQPFGRPGNALYNRYTRTIRNVGADANPRRLILFLKGYDTVNWDQGGPIEIVVRAATQGVGSYSRSIMWGGYSVAPAIKVLDAAGPSVGANGYPLAPYIYGNTLVGGTIYYSTVVLDMPAYTYAEVEISHTMAEVANAQAPSAAAQISFQGAEQGNTGAGASLITPRGQRQSHTFATDDQTSFNSAASTIGSFFIPTATGETVKIIGVQAYAQGGTGTVVKLQQDSGGTWTDITGSCTLSAAGTFTTANSYAVSAGGQYFRLVLVTAGSCTGSMVTVISEHS